MVEKIRPYPAYKDSGVDWLGEVPSSWGISKVKYLSPFQVGWTPPTGNDENFNGDNLWANISDLGDKTIADTAKRISDYAAKVASMNITPKGSLLYSFKLSVGSVSFAGRDMYTNEAIASFLEEGKLPLSYLYFALPRFVIENASTNIYGARILNQELIKNAILLAPSYVEAEAIANFLDHETAKIDTLIDKQQQLIKLLKEKRQAVISHDVTKGLNPAVPMKDSGVEWLGEVPEHWEVAKLRYLIDESAAGPYGASLTKTMYTTSGYRVYGQQQVIAGSFELGDYYISKEKYAEMKRYTVYPNDVLISVMGTVGKVAVVPANVEPGIINPRLVRYVFNKKRVLPEFIKIQISSSFHQNYLLKAAQGSTMDGLNMGILGGMSLAFPKDQEQQLILGHVKKVSDKFSRLISFSEKSLELLQERRTALISAAVTGKIDVRNWQPARTKIPTEARA